MRSVSSWPGTTTSSPAYGVDHDVAQRVEQVVAVEVGNGDVAVVERLDEPGRAAARRHVAAPVGVGRGQEDERRRRRGSPASRHRAGHASSSAPAALGGRYRDSSSSMVCDPSPWADVTGGRPRARPPRFRQCSARSSRSGGAIRPRAWSRLSARSEATMATVSTRAITPQRHVRRHVHLERLCRSAAS